MKISATIPRKQSKHGKASVERPERDRHKAFFSIKPLEWSKDKDKQIKMKQPTAKAGKSAGFEKILYEPPEKFIIWKKDLNDKVVTNNPDWTLIMTSLIDLTDKAANSVVRAALKQFKG